MSQVPQLEIVDDHLVIPEGCSAETTYDVVMNGRHVWSLQPRRDTSTTEDGTVVARWPKALRPYLHGRAEVLLRDHVTEDPVATGHHVFGGLDGDSADEEVRVVDRSGQPLLLDKWGRLIRPLAGDSTEVQDELMSELLRLLTTLREQAGVPAFVSYGTLLGAVRNGGLIGHDNDLDISYLSERGHPVDVVREGYRIERVLQQEGFAVRRGSGARMNVRLRLSDGFMRFIDVFTAHWMEGVLYTPSDTGFRLPRETILPLGTVELLGHQVPAPADPERLLAETYGPGWRVPDPSFKYHTPRWLARRLGGWFGGLKTHRKHWDAFYAASFDEVPQKPSRFARWVAVEHPDSRPLLDLGSGTGRDALWFAGEHGRPVTGYDYAWAAVRRSNRLARQRQVPATFALLNLYDTRAVLTLGAQLARAETPADLYARFTPHALDDRGLTNLLRTASMGLRRGGLLFLEFRTDEDRALPHVFGDHVRRFRQPDAVVAEVEACGGRVVHRVQGTGLAPLRREDPDVCRLVATWTR